MTIEEALFQAINGSSSDPFGIFVSIRDGTTISDFRVMYLNPAAAASFGRKEEADVRTLRQFMKALAVADEDALCTHFVGLAGGGAAIQQHFDMGKTDQGQARSFQMHAYGFGDGFAAHWRELTAGVRAQRDVEDAERLRAMNEMLERRVAERTAEAHARTQQLRELALSLADAEARERKRLAQLLHDHFQQLLSAAKLKTGIVRRLTTDQKVIDGAAQVERLLEEAISASHALTAELVPTVLYDAGLNAAVNAMARNIEQRHRIKPIVKMDDRAEPAVEQVRVLLFEAIRELVQNVLKHAKATTVNISSTLNTDGEIEINVIDDGQGFDPNSIAGRRNGKDAQPFGLIEIRERLGFIDAHVEINSDKTGTRVRLTVPTELRAPPPTEAGMADRGARKRAIPPRLPAGKVAHVIVADDHAIFREGMISLLAQEPLIQVVGTAANGEQTIQLTRELKPDLLLLDITMPLLNGIQVAGIVSKEMPQVRIVGLSMHKQQDMAAAMLDAGALGYFTKGGSSEMLLSMLREILWSPAAGDAPLTKH